MYAFPAVAVSDSIKVRWKSLVIDSEYKICKIQLLGPSSEIIASLEYRENGVLIYNSTDDELPVGYIPNVHQQFEIVANFETQRTRVSINGAPVSGFQSVPFVQACSELELVNFNARWCDLVVDDITAYYVPCTYRTICIEDVLGYPAKSRTFSVYTVANDPPLMTHTYVGDYATNGSGCFDICLSTGDSIKVLIEFPLWDKTLELDNALFDETTSNIYFDEVSSEPVQLLTLTHPTLVCPLSVAVQWDATRDYLDSLELNLRYLSNFLYDVFDGQVRLGDVTIEDNSSGLRQYQYSRK